MLVLLRERPVEIDQQAGIGAEHGRRPDEVGQVARHGGRAYIPGDVPLQIGPGKAEALVFTRNVVRGVVADQHDPGRRIRVADLQRLRPIGWNGVCERRQ